LSGSALIRYRFSFWINGEGLGVFNFWLNLQVFNSKTAKIGKANGKKLSVNLGKLLKKILLQGLLDGTKIGKNGAKSTNQ
jgi:hypothetical protein